MARVIDIRQWLDSIGYEPTPRGSEHDYDQTGTVSDPVWRTTPLPDRWTGNVGTQDLREEVEVFDNRGVKRGVFIPRELLWDSGPFLTLRCRFVVRDSPTEGGLFRFFVLDRETKECLLESAELMEDVLWGGEIAKIHAFLYEKYPDWRDPLAYWTDE